MFVIGTFAGYPPSMVRISHLTSRMNVDAIQDAFCSMSQWSWKENRRIGAWLEPWHCKEKDEGLRNYCELFQRIILKERNPWKTRAASCETEHEEVEPFRAPPGLPDPLIEETRIRESRFGYQTDVTATAESRLHPRYKLLKEARPFEGIASDKSSGELIRDSGPSGRDALPRDCNKCGGAISRLPGRRPAHPLAT